MEFIATVISDFESYVNHFLRFGSLKPGSVMVEVDENGKPLVNEKNEVIVVDYLPSTFLYRGQTGPFALKPKLGRVKGNRNLPDLERQLLDELKRRREITSSVLQLNDWELLIYAQHFGLATRLLDWTTNPLTALWFACNADNEEDGYVFFLEQRTLDLIDVSKEVSPFAISETKVLKPSLNNQRITAQNGWFTIHSIQEDTKQILPLDKEPAFEHKINAVMIPGKRKKTMIIKLNILGVNHETVYPGVEGTCKYLNWLNDI